MGTVDAGDTAGRLREEDQEEGHNYIDNIVKDDEQGIGKTFTDPDLGAPDGGKLMGYISLNFN